MPSTETIRVHAALITVSLIYGYFYVAVKLLMNGGIAPLINPSVTPPEFILLRFVLTALLVALLAKSFKLWHMPAKEDWRNIIGLGLVGVFLVQILIAWGLYYTTAFHSALIMATIPIMTLTFSIFLGREKYHVQKLIGIFMGFAGVTVLLMAKNPHMALPPGYLQGDFIILANAVLFSAYLLGSQKMLKKYNAFSFMGYNYMISAVLFAILFMGHSVFLGSAPGEVHTAGLSFIGTLGVPAWLLIAFVVVFASIGTYTLNNYALSRVSPSVVAVYMFIQPVISAATGFYFLFEPFNLEMALAAVITFTGLLMATTAGDKGVYLRTFLADGETKVMPLAREGCNSNGAEK